MKDLQFIESELSKWCMAQDDIDAAYLHGSTLSGRRREDSDIDVAIVCLSKRPESWTLLEWAGELSCVLGQDVDLGLLCTHNLIYLKEASLRGKRVYCRTEDLVDGFVASALGMYLSFCESRRPVVEAYHG